MPTPTITLDALSVEAPPPSPADWNDDGVVLLEGFLDPDLVADYQEEWADANGLHALHRAIDVNPDPEPGVEGGGHWDTSAGASANPMGLLVVDADRPGGWNETCPYMRYPALRALCTYPPLAEALAELNRGMPMGVHLNLTGQVSTQRNWHQDTYLNPDPVGDSYAAVWMALGDIHAASGVFQFIPGSHRWHRLLQTKIFASGIIDQRDPAWPAHTEAYLTELVEQEIIDRNAQVVDFAPSAGDVLIWHPRLYHRGSAPLVPNAYRPALIAHYSGIHARPDIVAAHAPAQQAGPGGGWYFPITTDQPTG